jgi:hypothetical protein
MLRLKRVLLAGSLGAVSLAQSGNGSSRALETVRALILKAAGTGDPVAWANDLMQADQAAEKLARSTAGGCCGNRCVRIGTFELHYRFNPIARRETYQHDLLQTIAVVHEGTPDGAEALVRLLPVGCGTIASPFTPYFRTVLGILEQKRWRDVADLRLSKIRAEAYETWWSLSMMTANDALVTDAQMNPADFVEGSAIARERAIAGYQSLVKSRHADADMVARLKSLIAGKDTEQRAWICYGD